MCLDLHNLFNKLTHCRLLGVGPNVPPLYVMDSSVASEWPSKVHEPAVKVVSAYLQVSERAFVVCIMSVTLHFMLKQVPTLRF